MGTLQVGHGSEYHLMRFLGRHRADLNRAIQEQLEDAVAARISAVDWLDFPYNKKNATGDGEILGVDFLGDRGGEAWRQFWPDRRPGVPNRQGMPSWDAIGIVTNSDGAKEWLLVEAKAHLGEFASRRAACGARGASRQVITKALQDTFTVLRPADGPTWDRVAERWLGSYYQLANRLAILRFLRANGQAARLLYLLFSGDTYKRCPATGTEWAAEFDAAYVAMGLAPRHGLTPWCHRVSIHVGTGRRV